MCMLNRRCMMSFFLFSVVLIQLPIATTYSLGAVLPTRWCSTQNVLNFVYMWMPNLLPFNISQEQQECLVLTSFAWRCLSAVVSSGVMKNMKLGVLYFDHNKVEEVPQNRILRQGYFITCCCDFDIRIFSWNVNLLQSLFINFHF